VNHHLKIAQDLGASYLAEGARAAEYRMRAIEPVFDVYETFVLDFSGVRGANSSFANALIVPLFAQHGSTALKKLRFRHCNPVVKVMLESALTLGMEAANENQVRT
jgi:hypothetical protein